MKLNFRIKTKEESNYVKLPEEIDFSDVDLFGQEGYDASNLIQNGIKIPPSFIVTSAAFDYFLTFNNIVTPLAKLLKEVKPFDRETAENVSQEIKRIFDSATFPDEIKYPVQEKYSNLSETTDSPLSILIPSHIIPDEFLTEKDRQHKEIVATGLDDILNHIKEIWCNLFSAQALEIRANKYYQGPISTGILIQKKIKNEVSIKAYSQSSDIGDKRFIDIKCIYGLIYNENFFEENCDIYRVAKEDGNLINTFVNEQRSMYIFDRQSSDGDHIKQANVSSAWVNIRKLDDKRLEEVVEIVKKLEEIYQTDLEVVIGLEGGELFIEGLTKHEVVIDENDEMAAPAKGVEIKSFAKQEPPKPQPEKPITKAKISELAKEIIENTKEAATDAAEQLKGFIPDLNFNKVTEQLQSKPGKIVEAEIDSTKMLFLNVSSFKSEYLSSVRNFDGGFINATDLVLNHSRLPEELIDSPTELRKLIGDYNIDISTAARSLNSKPLIYQFSSIGSFERKLLNVVEMKYKYDHDERFLEIPEALAIETIAVKKSRVEDGNKNIWISIPFVRNKKNLQDILKIIHLQGLQRSKSFKVFLEIVSPMTFFAFDENDFENFDGVIFNIEKIAKIGNYKSRLRETDLTGTIELIERFIKKYKLPEYVINLNVPDSQRVLKKLDHLKFSGIILNTLPDRSMIEYLSDL